MRWAAFSQVAHEIPDTSVAKDTLFVIQGVIHVWKHSYT